MASGEPGDTTSAARAWWKSLATENLDVKALVFLALLAVGCAVWGWLLRPPSSGPPPVPNSPRLTIHLLQAPHVEGLEIILWLLQTKNSPTVLKIDASGFLPEKTTIQWRMDVEFFSGEFCRPQPYPIHVTYLGSGPDYEVTGQAQIPTANAAGIFLAVDLCWRSGPPLTVNNSFFSAAFPRILVPDQAGTLTNALQLPGSSLSGYSPIGGATPTGVGPQTWAWSNALSDYFGSQASTEMPVFGSSTSEIQRENHNAFYSGILFGIAAGAVLSVVTLIPVVIDRRRKPPNQKSPSGPAAPIPDPAVPRQAPS